MTTRTTPEVPEATAGANAAYFAVKPEVSGMPANARSRNEKTPATTGWRRPESRPLREVRGLGAALAHHRDDAERGDGREAVGDEVEQHPADRGLGEREDADEDEAGVRDRAVGEEALDVGLGDGQDRTDHHRQGRDRRDADLPVPPVGADADVGEAQDGAEGRELGAGRHEPGDGGGGALVGVGGPRVERHGADLEEQADEGEDDTREQQPLEVAGGRGDRRGDGLEVARAGVAVEERGAEEEERARERPEEEVLQRGLLRQQATAAGQAGHDVERQREDLEPDEHRDEVVGADEDHHPEDGEEGEREDLGGRVPGAGRGVLLARARRRRPHRGEGVGPDPTEALGHDEDRDRRQDEERALEEERDAVDGDRAAEGDGLLVPRPHEQRDEGEDEDAGGQPDLDAVPLPARCEGLDEHPDDRPARDEEHRQDGQVRDVDGLELVHWALPGALAGAGSVTPTNCSVRSTAGLTRSSTGLG